MTWWMWLALVTASLILLAALGWRVWTRVRGLLREVREASRRAAATQAEAGSAFDAWLVERAEEDHELLESVAAPAGRTMASTDEMEH